MTYHTLKFFLFKKKPTAIIAAVEAIPTRIFLNFFDSLFNTYIYSGS
jgi:hypothetical protein